MAVAEFRKAALPKERPRGAENAEGRHFIRG